MQRTLILMLMWLGICLPTVSWAELGGTINSSAGWKARTKAAVPVAEKAGYSVHETLPASGGSVKEYVSASGLVFAVSWKTPVLPDLNSLLGKQYFAQYKTEAATDTHAGRGPLRINQEDFVVFSGGRLKAFRGMAYVPSLMPTGFDHNELR